MKVQGLFRNAQRTVTVPAGGVIFAIGDSGEEMYGVVRGQVSLDTDDHHIALIEVDDVFGEMAIIDKSPRMATATATEETELAVIDYRRFLFLVQETPTFALQVMSAMASRMRPPG
jgi:CRP/FNR family transcriptional regulator, cyclic AMP receptor protein